MTSKACRRPFLLRSVFSAVIPSGKDSVCKNRALAPSLLPYESCLRISSEVLFDTKSGSEYREGPNACSKGSRRLGQVCLVSLLMEDISVDPTPTKGSLPRPDILASTNRCYFSHPVCSLLLTPGLVTRDAYKQWLFHVHSPYPMFITPSSWSTPSK